MYSFLKQFTKLQFAIWLFASNVAGVARFTNPPGPDGDLTLNIGSQYTIEWENAGDDYSELSLGLLAEADSNIFWLLSNVFKYTSQNYNWNAVALGNGITLSQGNNFNFILVNGTQFGEQVLSASFVINNSTTSSSATASPTTKSSATAGTATATSTSSPASSSPSSSGLSSGAKAGIGVGVAVAAILAFSALFFIFQRRRNANRQKEDMTKHPQEMENNHVYGRPPAYGVAGPDGVCPMTPGTMTTQGTQELSSVKGENRVHELDPKPMIYEAP